MKMTIKDRMVIGALLPREGSILVQSVIKSINDKTVLKEEELKAIKITKTKTGYSWNEKLAEKIVVDIDLSDAEVAFLKQQVAKKDKEQTITPDILDLCLKIQSA